MVWKKRNFTKTGIIELQPPISILFLRPSVMHWIVAPGLAIKNLPDGSGQQLEAIKETMIDVEGRFRYCNGKTGLAYLDIIREIKNLLSSCKRIQVSGEYAMIKAAAKMDG